MPVFKTKPIPSVEIFFRLAARYASSGIWEVLTVRVTRNLAQRAEMRLSQISAFFARFFTLYK